MVLIIFLATAKLAQNQLHQKAFLKSSGVALIDFKYRADNLKPDWQPDSRLFWHKIIERLILNSFFREFL